MNKVPIIFAKLAALYKGLQGRLRGLAQRNRSYLPNDLIEYYQRYAVIRDQLGSEMPELYSDLPVRDLPKGDSAGDFTRDQFEPLIQDIEYILELRANSELKVDIATQEPISEERPALVFISHGKSPDWREVQDYVEKDLDISTLELAQQPSKGRTVLQKLDEESNKCSFAVVVMTGDDDLGIGAPRARENVMH